MACQLGESGTRTEAIQSRARRIYGILGTAIVVRTRGGTPVRVGVFVDVCVGAEGARAVKPLERLGPTRYAKSEDPAKMTYSIPDFVSRNTTQNQEFFPVLESTSPRSKIKT